MHIHIDILLYNQKSHPHSPGVAARLVSGGGGGGGGGGGDSSGKVCLLPNMIGRMPAHEPTNPRPPAKTQSPEKTQPPRCHIHI